MLHLIREPVPEPDLSLPEVAMRIDRQKLSKRLWRGVADDGAGFGCELPSPLRDGDTIFQTPAARYVIRQQPEAVLEIALDITPPSAAAGIGWAIGNLHLELSAETTRLLTPDDTATRRLLARIGVPFRETTAVFRPGRFVRGPGPALARELGPSHQH
ncbi:MAG: urease accessory protein UreE [Opitutaceae bacterium]|jgi:urease accessory protein|nr:urease accessory protein UreE [Opitutaceae bacterium]